MRTFLIALVVLLICVSVYAYQNNPQGCVKLGNDLAVDLPAVLNYRGAPSTNAASGAAPTTNASEAPPAAQPTADEPPAPVTPPAVPPPPPVKKWSPPDPIPAQANWTWTTVDDQTYSNVVISKIEPDAVSITHAMGVARIDTSTLPADIQKVLNYDPEAAAAARAEEKRQADHPYYTLAQMADAEAAAQQVHKLLAWISCSKDDLVPGTAEGDEAQLAQMELGYLKDKAIIIVVDENNEMPQTPALVHHQFSQFDDGALPGGANYQAPKVVFSSPDATQIFGRVSYTEAKAQGTQALVSALNLIKQDPDAQAIFNGQPTQPSTATTPSPVAPAAQPPATPSTPVSGTE